MTRLRNFLLGNTYGGVNKELAPHVIPNNAAAKTDNWILRNKGLEKAKGWETFTDQVLTTGATVNDATYASVPVDILRIDEYFKDSGSSYLLAFTEKHVYYFDDANTDLWLPITPGGSPVNTTLGGDEDAAQTVLSVADSTGFAQYDEIIVGLGTANAEYMVVTAVDAGGANELTVQRPDWETSGTGLKNDHSSGERVDQLTSMAVGTDSTLYDSENTDDTYYFTDGTNAVGTWDASGTPTQSSNLGGLESGDDVEGIGTTSADVKARCVRAFENFLVLGYMVEEGTTIPQKIRWSQYGDFTTWENETDGTGQAGYATFEGVDFIVRMQQMKRELLIYRERSIEAMSYIGEPDIFAFRRAETGTGLLAPDALVDLGDRHIFAGPDDFYSFNGISLQSLGDGAITRDFFENLDPSQKSKVKAFLIEEESEIWFAYSTTGNSVCDQAYVYSIPLNKWSGPRDMDVTAYGYYDRQADVTWDGTSGTWDETENQWDSRRFLSNNPINLMGNDDGLIFIVDEVDDANGSSISARYEGKVTNCGTDEKKRLQKVRVEMRQDDSSTISVYVGVRNFVGEDVTWHGPYTVDVTSGGEPYVWCDLIGRWFQIRVDTSDPANLREIELFFYPLGHW